MWRYYPELLSSAVPRYTSYPTAAEFRPVEAAFHAQGLAAVEAETSLSLYLHIPYCDAICWYCGCNTGAAGHRRRLGAYMQALDREIGTAARMLQGRGRVRRVAFGGGMEMALACDLIVAARDARFALPEVRRGIVASGGGAIRLARRLPYHLAVEMALTGSPRDAEWCHAHGLVNRLSEPGHALQTALELADELLCNGPLALAATVAIMRTAAAQGENAAWTQQDEILAPVRASRDREEGIAAFLERRAPRWTGR